MNLSTVAVDLSLNVESMFVPLDVSILICTTDVRIPARMLSLDVPSM